MIIQHVSHPSFREYGAIIDGYDPAPLLAALERTKKPADSVVYVPSEKSFEELDIYKQLSDGVYGGMPIQIGYCNGNNRKLNCLEYHRGSEINVCLYDTVLLLARLQSVRDGHIHTSEVEAFLLPSGTMALIYETTLHYAPCTAEGEDGFRVAIVLPRGTNTEIPESDIKNDEDRLLRARNKWLIAHPESDEAKAGAFPGLTGENITLKSGGKA